MSQSLTFIGLHLVFATKEHRKLIPPVLLPQLHAVIGNLINEHGGQSILVGGPTDHVHALFILERTCKPADVAREVKHRSSRWLSNQPEILGKFEWQSGYSMFSVSQSQIETVKRYIANQVEHHRVVSLSREIETFLLKHNLLRSNVV